MNVRLLIPTILFILVFPNVIFGQKNPKITFHTPEISAFEKYGSHPVSLMTGTPSVDIPIFTINEGDLSHIISLSHHGGGIKVNEMATWVGLGWSLNVGGYITRSIRGAEDEASPGGYYNGSFYLDPNKLSSCVLETGGGIIHEEWLLTEGVALDKEPDLFSFKFNDRNGKFLFDRYRKSNLFPTQDLDITVQDNQLNEFIIIDEVGTKYYFGQNGHERHNRFDFLGEPLGVERKITWFLTRIESANRQDYINFNYEPITQSYPNLSSEIKIRSIYNLCNSSYQPRNFNKTRVKGFILSNIESNKYTVDFNYTTNRTDIINGAKLNSIVVKNKENVILKNFNLHTSYFNAPYAGSPDSRHTDYYAIDDRDTRRLRLDSIQEFNGSIYKPSYRFNYFEEINLPRRLSFSQDTRGYYNGKLYNTKLTPKILELESCTNLGLADRSPSWPHAKVFALEKITYPTGGHTDFVYELNQIKEFYTENVKENIWKDISLAANDLDPGGYEDECYNKPRKTSTTSPVLIAPEMIYIGGLRVIISSWRCNLGAGGSGPHQSGEKYRVEVFNLTTGLTSNPKYIMTDGYGYVDYDNGLVEFKNLDLVINEGDQYQITVSMIHSTELGPYPYLDMQADILHYKQGSADRQIAAEGIRLKEKLVSDGQTTQHISYDYHGSGEEMGFNQRFYSDLEPIFSMSDRCNSVIKISSIPNVDLLSLHGNYIGYSKVSEITDGNGYSTTTFNVSDYQEWVLPAIGDDYLKYDILHGTIASKFFFDQDGNPIYKEENNYITSQELIFDEKFGAEALKSFTFDTHDAWCSDPSSNSSSILSFHKQYNYINSWLTNKTTITTQHNTLGEIVSTSETKNDSEFHRFPTESVTYDSQGNKLTSKTIYSTDLRFGTCNQNLNSTLTTIRENYFQDCQTVPNCSVYFTCWEDSFNQKYVDILTAYETYNNCMNSEYTVAGNTMKVIKKMHDQNIIKPIETTNYIAYKTGENTWGSEKIISTIYYEYEELNNVITLKNISTAPLSKGDDITSFANVNVFDNNGYSLIKDNDYESELNYKYDSSRIVEYIKEDGTPVVYLWSYNNQYPVAKIIGKNYDQVEQALGVTFINSLRITTLKKTINNHLETLKSNSALSLCLINTYTYKYGVGITSITDPKGFTIYYEYDEFNRLAFIKDADGNILSNNQYNYKN